MSRTSQLLIALAVITTTVVVGKTMLRLPPAEPQWPAVPYYAEIDRRPSERQPVPKPLRRVATNPQLQTLASGDSAPSLPASTVRPPGPGDPPLSSRRKLLTWDQAGEGWVIFISNSPTIFGPPRYFATVFSPEVQITPTNAGEFFTATYNNTIWPQLHGEIARR